MNLMEAIRRKAQENPEALQSARSQELVKVIQSGDAQKGIETANNILQSYGVSKEEALRIGAQFFGGRR